MKQKSWKIIFLFLLKLKMDNLAGDKEIPLLSDYDMQVKVLCWLLNLCKFSLGPYLVFYYLDKYVGRKM